MLPYNKTGDEHIPDDMPFEFRQQLLKQYKPEELKQIWAASKEYRDWVDKTMLTAIHEYIQSDKLKEYSAISSMRSFILRRVLLNDLNQLIREVSKDDEG